MKAFITGGAGFVGTHLARRLDDPVIFDRVLGHGRADLAPMMRGCDTVFHLAANPDIAKAAEDPTIDFWDGTFLTQHVLEAMRENGVGRIFYASGSGVYGDCPGVVLREDHGPCLPISPYGASKLAAEALICAYAHMFGIVGRVFRFANIVGPGQTHGVAYDFLRKLRENPNELLILGNGTQTKSYIHIDDALDAVMLVADRAAPALYEVYNVATDDAVTVNYIAETAVLELLRTGERTQVRRSQGDRGWKGDVPQVRLDCVKIRALGWRPKRSSAEAILASIRAMNLAPA